jgi:3-phenylpropionate/trans-cinnamate dioxygenase ferredoxin reductase subunit
MSDALDWGSRTGEAGPGPAVIVGAGQAGAYAAVALRSGGFTGRILLLGDEAERPHERPPFSKAVLTAEAEPPVSHFHPDAHDAEHGIETRLGTRVKRIDPGTRIVHLADGGHIPYGSLLLATGGRARSLRVPGAERVLSLRTLDDARLLRGRLRTGTTVVCVGAGVIGLEVASSARTRGCRVTVIEAGPSAMGRSLPPVIADWLTDLHRLAGVDIRFGTGVTAVTSEGVTCEDGAIVPADAVVAGIGMERNTDLATDAGLLVEDGIAVDEFGRTSVPGIWAAGDVTGTAARLGVVTLSGAGRRGVWHRRGLFRVGHRPAPASLPIGSSPTTLRPPILRQSHACQPS